MNIDFEKETKEINLKLQQADGYLDCEKIIIANIQKQLSQNASLTDTEAYLKKLLKYFQDLSVINKHSGDNINYTYAAGFLNTIISTPYWHSWIRINN